MAIAQPLHEHSSFLYNHTIYSITAMSTAEAAASILLETFHRAANVHILDETHGLFGDLYEPKDVISSLITLASTEENVGNPSETEIPLIAVKSQTYAETTIVNQKGEQLIPHEIPVEFHNTTSNTTIRVRWIDEHHHNPEATHRWDVGPSSTFEQYAKPGHFFLLSAVILSDRARSSEETITLFEDHQQVEFVVGAYRPKRALPSMSPHCILIADDDVCTDEESPFIIETLLLDDSKFDELVMAAAALDHVEGFTGREQRHTTTSMLKTIIFNLIKHPKEDKFHKIRKHICASWGAIELLKVIGFSRMKSTTPSSPQKEDGAEPIKEDYLVLPKSLARDAAFLKTCKLAVDMLSTLSSRTDPNFIADIAPPTPWQEAVIMSGGSSGRRRRGGRGMFISDDERWARAERVNRNRRNGRGRRPNRGDAPSSRGNWGR
jgi:hypothetical protein